MLRKGCRSPTRGGSAVAREVVQLNVLAHLAACDPRPREEEACVPLRDSSREDLLTQLSPNRMRFDPAALAKAAKAAPFAMVYG